MKSEQLTKEEVLRLVAAAGMEETYNSMPEEWQRRFLRFCTGEGGLPITYDSFFKKIFDPELYPERLSRLLSLVLGRELKVRRALPNEGTRILDEGSLLLSGPTDEAVPKGERGEGEEIFLPGYQEGVYGGAIGEKRCALQGGSGGVDA